MALNTRRGFKPDHEEFGRFLMSNQALDPVKAAAEDAAKIAAANEVAAGSTSYAANFKTTEGPVMVFDGNARRTMHVYNDARQAARREFGAAPGHVGGTRALRRAGAVVGEMKGEIG